MGAFQLPDSVLGDAIGCLIYSFLCLIANSLLVWLIWTHNERKTCTGFFCVAHHHYFSLTPHVRHRIHRLLHTYRHLLEHRPAAL